MEIARFIQRREQSGDTRTAIAKRLGKSSAFVTQHASLLTLATDLRAAYDDGRCRDVLTLYELNNFSRQFPDAVTDFLQTVPEITRGAAEAFRHSVRQAPPDAVASAIESPAQRRNVQDLKRASARRLSIMVRHQGALYALRADLSPSTPRQGWIEEPGTGVRKEVNLEDLRIDSILSA